MSEKVESLQEQVQGSISRAEDLKKREDELWEPAFNRMREIQLRRENPYEIRARIYTAP